MKKSDETLCEVCHTRPARHHICYGGTGKSSHLCSECFEKSAPPEVRQSHAEMREARCQYCGGQPCMGGTDMLAMMTGIQKQKYMCMPCAMEHNRYMQEQLPQDTSGLSQQEQLALIRKLNEDVDKHMEQ